MSATVINRMLLMGVPFSAYYSPACQAVRACNPDGSCCLQQFCY